MATTDRPRRPRRTRAEEQPELDVVISEDPAALLAGLDDLEPAGQTASTAFGGEDSWAKLSLRIFIATLLPIRVRQGTGLVSRLPPAGAAAPPPRTPPGRGLRSPTGWPASRRQRQVRGGAAGRS